MMCVTSGLLLMIATAVAWTNAHIRNIEEELPDAIEEPESDPVVALAPSPVD